MKSKGKSRTRGSGTRNLESLSHKLQMLWMDCHLILPLTLSLFMVPPFFFPFLFLCFLISLFLGTVFDRYSVKLCPSVDALLYLQVLSSYF